MKPDRDPVKRHVVVGGVTGCLLAVALMVAPPMGTDLSAQVAHADFFRQYGFTPIDMRWYGGTNQFGYSWVSPMIMAVLGVRGAGALAVAVSSVTLAVLLTRTGAIRPVLASVLGAFAFAGNMVSGRVTYALGVAVALVALVVLVPTLAMPRGRARRIPRLVAVACLGVLASATSPPAGAFLGLAGGAVILVYGWGSGRSPWRVGVGFAVGLGAALPLCVTALLASESGIMNISEVDAGRAIVTGLIAAALVRQPVVRIGALLAALMVVVVYAVPTPVGLNATRLATMFALPVVAGYAPMPALLARIVRARRDAVWLWPVLVALTLWQPPLLMRDLLDAGNPTAQRGYFTPLIGQLEQIRPAGRVEIPPTRDYWEAAYVADAIPLARGWLRQVDLKRNELFFGGVIDANTYQTWLLDHGVTHVALPDAELSWVGRTESALIASNPPYLREVWRSQHWTLFEVVDERKMVDGATLVEATGGTVVFDVSSPGDVLVRVTMSRWLSVSGPADATVIAAGRWTTVRTSAAGRYTLTSGF